MATIGFIVRTDVERSMASAASVKARHEARLLGIPGVVGVGLGRSGDQVVIQVFVSKDTPRVRKTVPDVLEDVPVEIVVSGPLRAL